MANYADKRKKKLKTSKARSGAQLFMSDEAKEQMLNRPSRGAEIERLIDRSIKNRRKEGKITPEESGKTSAYTYGDMIARSYGNDAAMKYMEGGAVKKYMGGGKVRGYKDGGGVCRGGGAAVSGTKFSGVK
jgi:hypothetical protein